MSPRSRSTSSSTYDRRTPDYDRGYGRREASRDERHSYRWRDERAPRYPQYQDHAPQWGRNRSPSPQRHHGRNDAPHRYQDGRRGEYRQGGSYAGRGRTPQRDNRTYHSAPDSRPVDGLWTRTIFPPNINAAPRDYAGHPQFPEDTILDDTSDYGDDDVKTPANYADNEGVRWERAIAGANAGRIYAKIKVPLESADAGPWASAQPVTTVDQARNVLRWVHRGDAATLAFLKHAMTRLGSDPTLPRTIGEVTLLQYQNQAVAQYKTVVSGSHRGRPKLANAGRATHPFQGTTNPVPMGAPRAASIETDDVPDASGDSGDETTPPAAIEAVTSRAAQLGTSPTSDDEHVALTEEVGDNPGRPV
ncbi:hypothetical protein B0H15DRAFT_807346 [Mycena belliarum]|uniref:Uncharacterized protein n=1 Tax=Mycena belliarum TaxID=1033014 RepID=A0AAD6TPW1_9AGAR|nr:hypothetical protein B0H15DRAFT_807346 [Mycena belliae]